MIGSRGRLLATQAGDVRLRIPKLGKGSFFPVLLEPRRRIDQGAAVGVGQPTRLFVAALQECREGPPTHGTGGDGAQWA